MKVSSTELPPRQVVPGHRSRQGPSGPSHGRRLSAACRDASTCPDSDAARRRADGRADDRSRSHRRRSARSTLPEVVTEAMEQEKVEPYTRPQRGIHRVRSAASQGRHRPGAKSRARRLQGLAAHHRRRATSRRQQVEDVITAPARVLCAVGARRTGRGDWAIVSGWTCKATSRAAKSPASTARRPSTSSTDDSAQPRTGLRRTAGRPVGWRSEGVHAEHARRLSRQRSRWQAGRSSRSRALGQGARAARARRRVRPAGRRLRRRRRAAHGDRHAAAPARGRARARTSSRKRR